MIPEIAEEIRRRGITRICHFTQSTNLLTIFADREGILPTRQLKGRKDSVHIPTDLERIDGLDDNVSCSIEYPNGWYMDVARDRETVFEDWVILLISPDYLGIEGTRFSPRNVAANRGRDAVPGIDGLRAMFATKVAGSGGMIRHRGPKHLLCCPTDDQAEVLTPGRVAIKDIVGIAVTDIAQAKREFARLLQVDGELGNTRVVVAPALFDARALSGSIRSGLRPSETKWNPDER